MLPILLSARTFSANSKSSGPLSKAPWPKSANPASAPTAPPAPAATNFQPSSFPSPTKAAAVVCMCQGSWRCGCAKPSAPARPWKSSSTNWGLSFCANTASSAPQPQSKPREIPNDLLSRVSAKAAGNRRAARRNHSPQSSVCVTKNEPLRKDLLDPQLRRPKSLSRPICHRKARNAGAGPSRAIAGAGGATFLIMRSPAIARCQYRSVALTAAALWIPKAAKRTPLLKPRAQGGGSL